MHSSDGNWLCWAPKSAESKWKSAHATRIRSRSPTLAASLAYVLGARQGVGLETRQRKPTHELSLSERAGVTRRPHQEVGRAADGSPQGGARVAAYAAQRHDGGRVKVLHNETHEIFALEYDLYRHFRFVFSFVKCVSRTDSNVERAGPRSCCSDVGAEIAEMTQFRGCTQRILRFQRVDL